MSKFAIPQAWEPTGMPWLEDDRIAAGRSERESRLDTRKMVHEQSKRHGQRVPRHVYFVEATGTDLIKIGSAFDVELRIEQLRAMSPVRLRLVFYVLHGGVTLERHLHRLFRRRRSHGEWFRVGIEEMQATVDALIEQIAALKASAQ
mgnify:FL=1